MSETRNFLPIDPTVFALFPHGTDTYINPQGDTWRSDEYERGDAINALYQAIKGEEFKDKYILSGPSTLGYQFDQKWAEAVLMAAKAISEGKTHIIQCGFSRGFVEENVIPHKLKKILCLIKETKENGKTIAYFKEELEKILKHEKEKTASNNSVVNCLKGGRISPTGSPPPEKNNADLDGADGLVVVKPANYITFVTNQECIEYLDGNTIREFEKKPKRITEKKTITESKKEFVKYTVENEFDIDLDKLLNIDPDKIIISTPGIDPVPGQKIEGIGDAIKTLRGYSVNWVNPDFFKISDVVTQYHAYLMSDEFTQNFEVAIPKPENPTKTIVQYTRLRGSHGTACGRMALQDGTKVTATGKTIPSANFAPNRAKGSILHYTQKYVLGEMVDMFLDRKAVIDVNESEKAADCALLSVNSLEELNKVRQGVKYINLIFVGYVRVKYTNEKNESVDELHYIDKRFNCDQLIKKADKKDFLSLFDKEFNVLPNQPPVPLSSEQIEKVYRLTGHVRPVSHASKTIKSLVRKLKNDDANQSHYKDIKLKLLNKMQANKDGYDLLREGHYRGLSNMGCRNALIGINADGKTPETMLFDEIPELNAPMGYINQEHLELAIAKTKLFEGLGEINEFLNKLICVFNDPEGGYLDAPMSAHDLPVIFMSRDFDPNRKDAVSSLKLATRFAYIQVGLNLFFVDKQENTCVKVAAKPGNGKTISDFCAEHKVADKTLDKPMKMNIQTLVALKKVSDKLPHFTRNAELIHDFCASPDATINGILIFTQKLQPLVNQRLNGILNSRFPDVDNNELIDFNKNIAESKKIVDLLAKLQDQVNLYIQNNRIGIHDAKHDAYKDNARLLLDGITSLWENHIHNVCSNIRNRKSLITVAIDDLTNSSSKDEASESSRNIFSIRQLDVNKLLSILRDISSIELKIAKIAEAKLLSDDLGSQLQVEVASLRTYLDGRISSYYQAEVVKLDKLIEEIVTEQFNFDNLAQLEKQLVIFDNAFHELNDLRLVNAKDCNRLVELNAQLVVNFQKKLSRIFEIFRNKSDSIGAFNLSNVLPQLNHCPHVRALLKRIYLHHFNDELKDLTLLVAKTAKDADESVDKFNFIESDLGKITADCQLADQLYQDSRARYFTRAVSELKDQDILQSIDDVDAKVQVISAHISSLQRNIININKLKATIEESVQFHLNNLNSDYLVRKSALLSDFKQPFCEIAEDDPELVSTLKAEIGSKFNLVVAEQATIKESADRLIGLKASQAEAALQMALNNQRESLQHLNLLKFDLQKQRKLFEVQLSRLARLKAGLSSIELGFVSIIEHEMTESLKKDPRDDKKVSYAYTLELINDHLDPLVIKDDAFYDKYSKNALSYFNSDIESHRRIGHAMLGIGIALAVVAVAALAIYMTGGLASFLVAGWMFSAFYAGTGAVGGGALIASITGGLGLKNAQQSVIYEKMHERAEAIKPKPMIVPSAA